LKRLLGIDYGERRIGIALSDENQMFPSPYLTIDVKKEQNYFEKIKSIIREKNIGKIIIGNPLTVEGNDTEKSKIIKDFAYKLSKFVDLPIDFWEETRTTQKAEAILKSTKKSLKQNKAKLDKIAASLILEDYMKHN